MKPIPVRSRDEFGFDTVKVSVVLPFNGMLSAPKDLLMVGGSATMMLAVAADPVPPFVEVTALVELFFTP